MLGFWTTEEAANTAIVSLIESYGNRHQAKTDEAWELKSLLCVDLLHGERFGISSELGQRHQTVNIAKFVPALEAEL